MKAILFMRPQVGRGINQEVHHAQSAPRRLDTPRSYVVMLWCLVLVLCVVGLCGQLEHDETGNAE